MTWPNVKFVELTTGKFIVKIILRQQRFDLILTKHLCFPKNNSVSLTIDSKSDSEHCK